MDQTYKAKVDNSFDFEIDRDLLKSIDVIKTKEHNYHILSDYKSYTPEIISSDFETKHYKIKVNNKVYTVKLSDDLDTLIKDMGFEVSATKVVNDIKAPMPGLILDLSVSIGQDVKENDTLLILEAMKMENVLTSPRDGVIKAISIAKGDAVEKNQLLITFE